MHVIHLVNPILGARFPPIFSNDQIFLLLFFFSFLILKHCFLFMEVKYGHCLGCAVTETYKVTEKEKNALYNLTTAREPHCKF